MTTLVLFWALALALPNQQSAPAPAASKSTNLDFEFFKTRVQPIFLAKRPGRARCVSCHAGPTAPAALRLQPLSKGAATWDDEQSHKNFEATMRVVSPGDPHSALLIHPLAESAGGDFFHSGGKHFASQNDPEWLVLEAWVMGQTSGPRAESR